MRRPEISGWVSVAARRPTTTISASSAPCPCGGLMLHGDTDELVPEPAVKKLVDKLNTQKNVTVDYRILPWRRPRLRPACGHDFRASRRLRAQNRHPPARWHSPPTERFAHSDPDQEAAASCAMPPLLLVLYRLLYRPGLPWTGLPWTRLPWIGVSRPLNRAIRSQRFREPARRASPAILDIADHAHGQPRISARGDGARLRLPMHRHGSPRCRPCSRGRAPAISASTAPPTACISATSCRS